MRNPIKPGDRFGKWTVLEQFKTEEQQLHKYWLSRCDCGTERAIPSSCLRTGRSQSCGCARKERGGAGAKKAERVSKSRREKPEYTAWRSMKWRCLHPKAPGWKNYGGRGIKICDRWLESFDNFYQDMGPRPGPEYSIDRINNDGHYEPGNCRWATPVEQALNRRTTARSPLVYNNRTWSLSELAREAGIHPATLRSRLDSDIPLEVALTMPSLGRGYANKAGLVTEYRRKIERERRNPTPDRDQAG